MSLASGARRSGALPAVQRAAVRRMLDPAGRRRPRVRRLRAPFALVFLAVAVGGAANRACKGELLRSLANGAWLGARAVVPLAVLVVVMHLAWSRFR